MTVFDSIKNKNIDELVDWIDKYFTFDTAPYWTWWNENYCNKCEAVVFTDDEDYEIDYAYCEHGGNCRFFKEMKDVPDIKQTIKMWLESEYETKGETNG